MSAEGGRRRQAALRLCGKAAGDAWTAQLERDWTDALNAVARTMLRGVEGAATRRAA
jgi:hypothetical protein